MKLRKLVVALAVAIASLSVPAVASAGPVQDAQDLVDDGRGATWSLVEAASECVPPTNCL